MADHRLAAALARLADLHKGARPSELAALQARLQQTAASLKLAEIELQRVTELQQRKAASTDDLDRSRSNRDIQQARLTELNAELTTARLGARPDAIAAAAEAVKSTAAARKQAHWNLSQKAAAAPLAAVVEDTFFRPGEWVAPGQPVVALLPPGNLKARFFVPQADAGRFAPGRELTISWDGGRPLPATVSYVSRQMEFTPPVIYSRESRAKLMFMVEATFAADGRDDLRVGQPVEVRLAAGR